ncbi:putative membrane-anchored protein [Pelomonas saccharophila]|uniref:Membrane-anchored protein n=1 Tax=Roseateles saccharophilus TaxID=304 RepID=A0ABU1YND8_ROSSA|nr:DUF2167 domain-containing protein [Roseateles saccharophilus]MDR7270372.1 putative membrane-anchored protein [Roseateles saccharophilus]
MNKSFRGLLAALAACMGLAARAADTPPENPAWTEAKAVAKAGPADIAIAGQATLHLPADRVFIPQPQAGKLLTAMGNPGQHTELAGLVFPKGEGEWFATLRYIASGYVKDGDAKEWKADELLASYKEGTEASNEERRKMGAPALEIIGWAEAPAYEATQHRLVWAMSSKEKGAPADANLGVNYNTYALGREGYLSLNFITDLKDLPAQKPDAKALLGALEFDKGKRYEDFDSSTDHVAEYGLAALVVGVGAKKLGLLAVIFAFVAKFAKIIFIAVVGFGAAITKFFKRS